MIRGARSASASKTTSPARCAARRAATPTARPEPARPAYRRRRWRSRTRRLMPIHAGMSVSTSPPGEGSLGYPRGLIAPSRRGRSKNMIGDIIVELGFASREAVDEAVALSRLARPHHRADAHRVRSRAPASARPGARRAFRRRLHRPVQLRCRHGRGLAHRQRGVPALPGRPRRLPLQRRTRRRDRRPDQRADHRRGHDDHRAADPPRGGRRRGHPRPDRPSEPAR